MTKKELEELAKDFGRCTHIGGRFRCEGCRYQGTWRQKEGRCEAELKADVYHALRDLLDHWEDHDD